MRPERDSRCTVMVKTEGNEAKHARSANSDGFASVRTPQSPSNTRVHTSVKDGSYETKRSKSRT